MGNRGSDCVLIYPECVSHAAASSFRCELTGLDRGWKPANFSSSDLMVPLNALKRRVSLPPTGHT